MTTIRREEFVSALSRGGGSIDIRGLARALDHRVEADALQNIGGGDLVISGQELNRLYDALAVKQGWFGPKDEGVSPAVFEKLKQLVHGAPAPGGAADAGSARARTTGVGASVNATATGAANERVPPEKIFIFGDSHSQLTNGQLRDDHQLKIDSHLSYTCAEALAWLRTPEATTALKDRRLVVMMLGSNDIKHGRDGASVVRDLETIVRDLNARGLRVVAGTLPARFERFDATPELTSARNAADAFSAIGHGDFSRLRALPGQVVDAYSVDRDAQALNLERQQDTVNAWVQSGGDQKLRFGVLDVDVELNLASCEPTVATKLGHDCDVEPQYRTSQREPYQRSVPDTHFNERGYEAIARAVRDRFIAH